MASCNKCDDKHYGRGLCKKHYTEYYRLVNRERLLKYALDYAKTRKEKFPEKVRESKIRDYLKNGRNRNKKRFGLVEGQYDKMLAEQNGMCACCGQPETVKLHGKIKELAIDHDHETKKVRALLCQSCNIKLGVVEDPEWMELAHVYLEAHSKVAT